MRPRNRRTRNHQQNPTATAQGSSASKTVSFWGSRAANNSQLLGFFSPQRFTVRPQREPAANLK